MDIRELKEAIRQGGVVGAGGAGFPAYAKLDEKAQTIIMNCAECEPLLKLHRQLLAQHAYEILKAFHMIAETVGAKEAVIGIKREYKTAIAALREYLDEFPEIRIHLLDGVYPMGDEVVLIYEVTKKVIRPGGLPIEAGVVVMNVETVYNTYRVVWEDHPVTDKVVSVVGEVKRPVTLRVPLGCTIEEVVQMAGGALVRQPVYLLGGPMMGNIGSGQDVVTKTTNAVIVLAEDHSLILKKRSNPSIDMKRAASSCCQCETCTDLCPRHALGHPVTPHLFMRAASNKDFRDANPFLDTMFCSSCGLCELYSCPQGLSPRSLMAEYKLGLRKAGVKPPRVEAAPVSRAREYRKAPEERLEARLGLTKYNVEAPLQDTVVDVERVRIKLSQHIGAPAIPVVSKGETVSEGQLIARAADGLSVAIHASICGKVVDVTDAYVIINKSKQEG